MLLQKSRYHGVAAEIQLQIEQRIWLPGERIPSIRKMSRIQNISPMTVLKAYELLEAEGWIYAKPRSGYFVAAHLNRLAIPQQTIPQLTNRAIKINEHVFEVLTACKRPDIVPLGSAFPDPELFPLKELGQALAKTIKTMPAISAVTELPPGSVALRRAIAQRYIRDGIDVSIEDIVITSGAMESLGLSLMAVTKPGDTVAIESPAFYGVLQTVERLQLKAIEITTDPQFGMSVDALQHAVQHHDIKACWLMSKYQNPLGASMPKQDKLALLDVLTKAQIPLLEDDVYSELYFSEQKPQPIKAYDEQGLVLHCSSFSKCLAPGFRVGWVVAGRYAKQIEQLQLMTTLSAAVPNQLAIAEFVLYGRYDIHLRQLRRQLTSRQQQMQHAIEECFPAETKITRPSGGYFLWLVLPEHINTGELLHTLLDQYNISIAPGTLFASDHKYKNCMRINCSYLLTDKIRAALITLARCISSSPHK
ncbi:PLP-dependent aminotransferase family protein [Moritella marina ATCC 15381]|uniref:PLP-dependent aminotransferase family protein n=1 Tax=Moritella marina ATCC 15381 TaxID=1202962 RepID=A0A5J6WN77_MORMI|nr:PLP-dependent aminotransferase family protein [Moritella marina]QFI39586.1 PLP-dependent aminotransferase family protein [Moritella marina ATCC 15381]